VFSKHARVGARESRMAKEEIRVYPRKPRLRFSTAFSLVVRGFDRNQRIDMVERTNLQLASQDEVPTPLAVSSADGSGRAYEGCHLMAILATVKEPEPLTTSPRLIES
jgi:hypothetical protein